VGWTWEKQGRISLLHHAALNDFAELTTYAMNLKHNTVSFFPPC
jgi:hypothetical protein